MINLTVKQFSDINLYNNKNIENYMSKVISESANGILLSVFDDKLILMDNYKEKFYSGEYHFDRDNFIIDNFEEIKLSIDKNEFNDAIKQYFNKKATIDDIKESYKNIFSESENILTEDINNKLSSKLTEFDYFIDIIESVKNTDLTKFRSTELYENYIKRYNEFGSPYIYYFDWQNKVNLAITENESHNVYIKTNKDKANNLWKEESFRKQLKESVEVLEKDVVNGQKKIMSLINENKDLIILSPPEFKKLITKSILVENIKNGKNIINGIMELYHNFELGKHIETLKESYESEDERDEKDEKDEKDKKDEKEMHPSNDELDITIDTLSDIADKTDNEEAKSFLDQLIDKLSNMKNDSSVDPELLKEIVRLLSIEPEKEPEESEEGSEEESDEKIQKDTGESPEYSENKNNL